MTTLIVNAPATLPWAHHHLLTLLEQGCWPDLSVIIFMAAAAPLAAAQPPALVEQGSSTGPGSSRSGSSTGPGLDKLQQRYLEAARKLKARVLVCGQAARHYGLGEDKVRHPEIALTGYMELLNLTLGSRVQQGEDQTIIW